MIFNSPLSPQKADQIIDRLALSPGDRVLDVGCGNGEFLIRLVERKGILGLGVDPDADTIDQAKGAASRRIPEASCEFRAARIQDTLLDNKPFDLAICIGSTHAYGDGEAAYPTTIRELARVARPGGLLLIGETYWRREPSPEYLALLGTPAGIYRHHPANVSCAEEQGLVTLGAYVSSNDEWDLFEWSHQQRIEQAYALSPEDPSLARKLKWRRAWMKGYLRWGRETMGFGFYLFQKPALDHT